MKEASIKIIGPEIKARAGEVVKLKAEFAGPCWSCIHERRSKVGYERLDDQRNGKEHVYDVLVHEDTTHFIFSIGDEGRPDLAMTSDIGQLWCPVTVTDEVEPEPEPEPRPEPDPEPQPEPDPEPEKGLGSYQFSIGTASDLHICVDNDDNTKEKTDDWSDERDFRLAMDKFVANKNIKCIMSCGDILESGSPKEGTPDDDYNNFFEIYDVHYWQIYGMRFFTCQGNHDFFGMFESRKGDTVMPERFTNYNSIDGHNRSVRDRIGKLSIGGQGINGIVDNGRNRIVFDTNDGKVHTSGQDDMNFHAYNAFVEMYKEAAGYKDSVAPFDNRYSDNAVAAMTDYVFRNWESCKDNLSGWNAGRNGMRNAYSKLNYWMCKGDNVFIFLSLDYGSDVWEINDSWHDRMMHARTLLDLNERDPYVRRMMEFVSDTGYSKADEPYNYQFYSVNTLIWLKEIIENNQGKKIFVFTHHYLPNKVGNGVGLPKDGAWSYASIHKAGELRPDGINIGSNCLCGVEFYFLNKLNNIFKNVVWFYGHSHISLEVEGHIDNHDYAIVQPGEQYAYTKASLTPIGTSAWNIALPSLSKPRNIVGNESERMYEDAEMAVVDIYENGIVFKGYKLCKDNKDVYDPEKPLVEKTIILI